MLVWIARLVSVLCLSLLLALSSSCFQLGNTDNSGTGEGPAATSGDFTEAEESLFEDGPVDIPITIAKLEAIDPELVYITIDPLEPVIPLTCADDQVLFQFEGGAGAVDDITTNPKIAAINTTLKTQQISDLHDDGSFEIAICGAPTEPIVLATMNQAEDRIGPPLIIEYDAETRSITVTSTNSSNLNTINNMLTDELGNMYYVTSKSTSPSTLMKGLQQTQQTTYNLLRRTRATKSLEVIVTGLTSLPLSVQAVNGALVAFINDAGDLYVSLRQASNEWRTPVRIGTIAHISGLSLEAAASALQISLIMSEEGLYTITINMMGLETVYQGQVNWEPSREEPADYEMEAIIEPASGRVEEEQDSEENAGVQKLFAFDAEDPDRLYVVESTDLCSYVMECGLPDLHGCSNDRGETSDGTTLSIFYVDSLSEGLPAEDMRITPICETQGMIVLEVSANTISNDQALAIMSTATGAFFKHPDLNDTQAINYQSIPLRNPKPSKKGEMIVACADEDFNRLYVAFFDEREHKYGTFIALTSASRDSCDPNNSNSYSIDTNYNVHYYQYDQPAVIYAAGNDILSEGLGLATDRRSRSR